MPAGTATVTTASSEGAKDTGGPQKATARSESPNEGGDPHMPNLVPKHLPPLGARAQGQQGGLCREVTRTEVTCGPVTATLLI